jgi:hypothetical protein
LTAAAVFAVAGGATTNTATAADLDYMAPPAYQPVYQPIWQGFYIGAHGGGGEADARASASYDYVDDFDPGTGSIRQFPQNPDPRRAPRRRAGRLQLAIRFAGLRPRG